MRFPRVARSHHSLVILLLFSLQACVPLTVTSQVLPPTLTPQPSGDLQVYFTDPSATALHGYEGGPDRALAEAIDAARLSVDVAAYSFNLWSLRDALVRAARRGAVVRVVMESDNLDEPEVQDLAAAGIPVLGDRREGLMHDKFVVIDRAEVWTGSMNFTVGGAYKDNNNLIVLRSTQVAEDFTTEFNEMFVEDRFGMAGREATPYPSVTVGGIPVEVYFSPEDGVAGRLLALIQSARESIYFLAYSFTSNDLGAALRERAAAGVTVAGVMDAGQVSSNQGTEFDPFRQAGLDVRLDGNEGLMHHKVLIIDRRFVVAGSYNFTGSAETHNDENVVIISSPELAARYLEEFQGVYDQAQP